MKHPITFTPFGMKESEDWRRPRAKYKLKKHSGKAYGTVQKYLKTNIAKMELRRREEQNAEWE